MPTTHAAARPPRSHTVLTSVALAVLALGVAGLVAFLLVFHGRVADGATRLDDGATRLQAGATELADGTATAQAGAQRLATGAGDLELSLIHI